METWVIFAWKSAFRSAEKRASPVSARLAAAHRVRHDRCNDMKAARDAAGSEGDLHETRISCSMGIGAGAGCHHGCNGAGQAAAETARYTRQVWSLCRYHWPRFRDGRQGALGGLQAARHRSRQRGVPIARNVALPAEKVKSGASLR